MAAAPHNANMTVTDGTWTDISGAIAPVPCWTCRRRRLRCDSRLPACAKCTKAGIQCLGYRSEKPLVWVGLGRRGHKKLSTVMTGVSSASLAEPAGSSATSVDGDAEATTSPEKYESSPDKMSPGSPNASVSDNGNSDVYDDMVPQQQATPVAGINNNSTQTMAMARPTSAAQAAATAGASTASASAPKPPKTAQTARSDLMVIRKGLAENSLSRLNYAIPQAQPRHPLLVGRDPESAYYIDYYLDRCCSECVIYEGEDVTPFKKFVQLAMDGHIVHHTVVALAAHHMAGSTALQGAVQDSSKLYAVGLVHKNKAMRHLREALMTSDQSDAVVAACLLLIWVELLENGLSVWRFHLDGMIGLLSARKAAAMASGGDGSGQARSPGNFQNYFEECCLVLHTFGSTLTRNKRDLSQIFGLEGVDRILERAELGSWTGCPSGLLKILWRVNSLCSAQGPRQPDAANELLSQLETFAGARWASAHADPTQIQQRYNLASAYQGAIYIYARRALQRHLEGDDGVEAHERLGRTAHIVLVQHLDEIRPDDPHFKGVLWSAFVAGAEARSGEDRAIARRILSDMYNFLHVRSVKRAIGLLEELWAAADDEGQSTEDVDHDPGGERSWLERVYKGGEELLLI